MMGNMWFRRKEPSTNKDRDMTAAVSRPSCSTHCGSEMNGEILCKIKRHNRENFFLLPLPKVSACLR